MKIKNKGKSVKDREYSDLNRGNYSFNFLNQYLKNPKDFENALKSLVNYLGQEKGFSSDEIIRLITKGGKPEAVDIPSCIFNNKLSSLESVVKYLKENLDLKYSEIAKLLNRDDRTIWATYSNSRKKFAKRFAVENNKYFIPALIISNRSLSVLESIVYYLKDDCNLKYSQIALLLCRDQRTIWTVYNRRRKK